MAGGATTRTEPWAEQKPYLETGFQEAGRLSVSYTHLTLPTIYSV